MGWGSFRDSITKPFKDVADDLKDSWDDLRHGDIIGALENLGQASLGFSFAMTGIPSAFNAALSFVDIPDAPPTEYQDRKRMTNGSANPRRIVYGETRVGGQVVYWESSGTDDAFFHLIVVFAAHSCKQVGDIYFNDKLAFAWNGSTHVVSADFSGKAIMFHETGKQTGANTSIVNDSPASWSTSHKLLGQTYAYFKLTYDKEAYAGGVPSVSSVIQGKDDIWDPRTDTYGYTDNQALCTLDYLMWEEGLRATSDEIDIPSFALGADVADELVPTYGGLTEKRYTVNGSMSFQSTMLDNFRMLLSAGSAICPYVNGNFVFVPGKYYQPEEQDEILLAHDLAFQLTGSGSVQKTEFDESDLISGVRFTPGSGKTQRLNYAKGTFVDPGSDYSLVEFAQLPVDGYISRDGEELVFDKSWPLTNSGTMARRLSKIIIENSRYGLTVNAKFKFTCLDLTVGDRLYLSIDGLGWDKRVFRIVNMSFGINTGADLVLREDNTDVWDWQEGDVVETPVPPALNLPNPFIISEPTNLSFSEELYSTNAKTQVKVRVTFSWETSVASATHDIQYRPVGGDWVPYATSWQDTKITFPDFEVGDYQFRVRAINSIGTQSGWIAKAYTVLGKLLPPPDVPGMVITDTTLSWSYPNKPEDFLGFEVRYQEGNDTTWESAAAASDGYTTNTSLGVANLLGGLKTFLVKAIDTSLIVSKNATFVITGLGDPVVDNIILTQEYKTLGWPGSIEYGSDKLNEFFYPSSNVNFYPVGNTEIYGNGDLIDGNGDITGIDQNLFYGPLSALYYGPPGDLYYDTSFLDLIYDFSYTVDPLDAGSQLVVTYQTTSDQSYLRRFALNSRDTSTLSSFGGVIRQTEAGEYRFRLTVPGASNVPIPKITSVVVSLDVPDIVESLEDVAILSTGTRLPITKTYRAIKHVSLTLQDDLSGATSPKILDRDNVLGPLIQVFNASGSPVNTIIDADIRGY